jgi:alkylation response protein AidB-like acyl-CoA dehydrogenase
MANLLVDEKDIKFILFEQIKIQEIFLQDRYKNWNEKAIGLLIGEARKFAEKELFPLNIQGDTIGATFEEGKVFSVPGTKPAYRKYVEDGWLTSCEDEAINGQQLPHAVNAAAHEIFFAANFPCMCYGNLTHDAAKLIELFGSDEQKRIFMEKMYGGQWTGTMCLTEPGAGSDVGAIELKAARNQNGTYALNGQKIFITNGEHDITENIVHLVLGRIEGDPAGTKGLSLFIVPKFRPNPDGSPGEFNDVRCIGIEHKMGLKASPTSTLSFGEKGACFGYLLGKEREGIRIMFHMMNSSRLEVGLWGQGTCSVSYHHALNYARDRKQGQNIAQTNSMEQVPIIQHPDIRRSLLLMKSHLEGMRAMLYYCGYAMDRLETSVSPEDKAKWQGIIDLLIPVCKSSPTEKGVEFASRAIQIYGGYGYTKEYPVEQFMRDSKVACIFEGTTGIQAMDFTFRKVRMQKGAVFAKFLEDMDVMIKKAADNPELKRYGLQLEKTKNELSYVPSFFEEQIKDSRLYYAFLNATPFLEAAGDVFIGWFLLWGAVTASEKLHTLFEKNKIAGHEQQKSFIQKNADAAFLDGKIQSAKFFIGNVLPQTEGKIAALKWMDVSAWDICEKSFG